MEHIVAACTEVDSAIVALATGVVVVDILVDHMTVAHTVGTAVAAEALADRKMKDCPLCLFLYQWM